MECLKALIAFGANINLRNSFGQTPLDVASMSPIGTCTHVLKYACICICTQVFFEGGGKGAIQPP